MIILSGSVHVSSGCTHDFSAYTYASNGHAALEFIRVLKKVVCEVPMIKPVVVLMATVVTLTIPAVICIAPNVIGTFWRSFIRLLCLYV